MRLIESLLPAHFTRLNRNIFFLAIFFSIASLVALLKVAPKDDEEGHTLLATLAEQKQYVSRKFSNSLSFNEINKGDKLFNGDQIFTGEGSTAKIVFLKSKNVLNIPPRGLVKIEEGLQGVNVEIQKGLAEFVIQKDQTLNIVKGTETITLSNELNENGSGKVYFNKDKLILQVDSGQINLNDTKGKVQNIKKDETVSVGATEITPISTVSLTSPVMDQRIDIWEGIPLAWKNKGPIDVMLSRKIDFSDNVIKIKAPSSPFLWTLPLETGSYYLMVKGSGKNAKESLPTSLQMVSPHSIKTFNPLNDSSLSLKRGEAVRLSWNQVPAEKYRVTVEDYDGRRSIVTSVPEIQLQDVKGSSLSWSVAPMLKSGVYLADSQKNLVKLSYEGENKILTPKMDQNFTFGKDKILLSWTTSPSENMKVKVTDSAGQVVLEKELVGNQLDFTPPTPGQFALTVASKDYPGVPEVSSSFNSTSKVAEWLTKNPPPVESIDEEEKRLELKFETYNKNLGELEVSIYTDEGLKNKIRTSKVLSTNISYAVKNFGTYCFVISPINKKSAWLPSAPQCATYKQLAAFEAVAAPKNLVMKFVKINDVGSYQIELPKVPRAENYEFHIYADPQGKKVVFSEKSKSNIINWPTKRSGIFYYKYRALDIKNRASEFSSIGQLIAPISPLSDWNE